MTDPYKMPEPLSTYEGLLMQYRALWRSYVLSKKLYTQTAQTLYDSRKEISLYKKEEIDSLRNLIETLTNEIEELEKRLGN
jgi:hypothetical protein